MTVRVKIIKLQKNKEYKNNISVVTDIYKVEICDISKRGYLVLKHAKKR